MKMKIKKSGGMIFGAELSAAERKALNMEVQRQLADYNRKNQLELQALILWQLHEQLGFGEKRLRRFYDIFDRELDALIERYQLEASDKAWICTEQLKEIGIDLEKWNNENA